MVYSSENKRILFVDDNPMFLTSIYRLLSKDYDITTAERAQQGLEIIKNHEPFAVVISDLKMPEMDGISFLSKVKELSHDSVRILFTGYANLENAIDAINNGYVFRILKKPCPEADIKRAVEAGLDQYHLLRNRSELEYVRKISKAMEGVIFGFTALVEARDPYTAGHQRRVATLSMALAKKMQLDRDRAEGLYMAALIHDIGKLYVPTEFLTKPGKLSKAEFTIIQQHAQVGSDILSPVDFPWPLSSIVLQHHERINGSGYPQGLSGDEILLESRIIAVSDVVEAMTFNRPYRAGLGLKKALNELKKNSGKLYDEDVVKTCMELFEDGTFIKIWKSEAVVTDILQEREA